MEMTPISVIKLMPVNKDQQTEFSRQLIQLALNGEINPLELDVYLKSIEDTLKLIRKNANMKTMAIDIALQYPEKTFSAYGAKITKSSRATYDYSGDQTWNELDAFEKDAKKKKVDRESILKNVTDKNIIADAVTGEVLIPPPKKTTDFLKIEL